MPLTKERFKQLAAQAGFNPEPDAQDAEAVLALERARKLFALACEEAAQTAAAVFHGDETRITHADATRRSVMAIRALYSDDVLFQLADPNYDMGLYDTPTPTRGPR
jgi:hypothetical protein